jgi:hypothetical protein
LQTGSALLFLLICLHSGFINVLHPCAGAKLFYLSGMRHGKYLKREVLNLARFISVMKFRPLSWRAAHGYLVCCSTS